MSDEKIKMTNYRRELIVFLICLMISLFFHLSSTLKLTSGNFIIDQFGFWCAIIIQACFKPIEVFFHESSHALAAIMTGRNFYEIGLTWQGTGYVVLGESSVFKMAFCAFAGYIGASFWGYLIFHSSLREKRITRLLLLFFCLVFMHKSSDIITVLVLLGITFVFFFAWLFVKPGAYILRFIGIFIMVSAIYSPSYLFKYSSVGDHILMQEYTNIDAKVWIVLWFVIASLSLYLAYKHIILLASFEEKPRYTSTC